MQFSQHIDKGFWTVLDKGLTVLFGLYFMKLAVSHLPAVEFGLFTLMYQSVFLLIVNFTASFALQPMLKYAAETEDIRSVMTIGLLMNLVFFIVAVILLLLFEPLLIVWITANPSEIKVLSELFRLLPWLALAFFIRNHILYMLQAKYDLIRLLIIDLCYFAAAIGLLHGYIAAGNLKDAADLFEINIWAYGFSSIVALALTLKYWRLTFRGWRERLKEMFHFGKFSLTSALANNVYEQTDNYMIITLLSPRELGVYAVAKTLMRAYPVFSQVIQSLLVPVLSRQYARNAADTIRVICEKAVCFSTIALLPMALGFLFLGPWFVSLLSGQAEYAQAGPVVQLSAALAVFVPWNAVFGCIYVAGGRMDIATLVNFLTIVLNVLLTFIFIPWLGLFGVMLSLILIHILIARLNQYILKKNDLLELSLRGVLSRIKDIKNFIAQRTLDS